MPHWSRCSGILHGLPHCRRRGCHPGQCQTKGVIKPAGVGCDEGADQLAGPRVVSEYAISAGRSDVKVSVRSCNKILRSGEPATTGGKQMRWQPPISFMVESATEIEAVKSCRSSSRSAKSVLQPCFLLSPLSVRRDRFARRLVPCFVFSIVNIVLPSRAFGGWSVLQYKRPSPRGAERAARGMSGPVRTVVGAVGLTGRLFH